MTRLITLAILCLCPALLTYAAEVPPAKILSVEKISDRAPHSAFTDLIYWNNQFVCAFREGRGHVSADGKIRVLTSVDGDQWESSALIELKDMDLRDAGLSVSPDGKLMLIGGACPRPKDGEHAPTGTFVSFSDDAKTWSKPQVVTKPGRWLWRVTWHDGKAYGVSYGSSANGVRASSLVASDDGIHYNDIVSQMLADGWPTEAVIRFDAHNTAYCLQRRDGKSNNSAMLGISNPPYTEWNWHDLGQFFGGPNLIQLPSGEWIAAGRMIVDGKAKTVLATLDAAKMTLTKLLELPSGGDTSYPGLVWHNDRLYVSYYSSHEDKTNIYLAQIELADPSASRGVPAPVQKASTPTNSKLTPKQLTASKKLGIAPDTIQPLLAKPLYQFTEPEVDLYLQFLSATEPDLRKRIAHLARKNIGQPYELYLLGELPFEPYDPQPIYCLGKSDCVVFSEHTYAMALSHNWPSFMKMLQRIRYRDGQIGVTTRNHYTEADWNKSNGWLVEDITADVASDKAVKFHQAIDRKNFFKKRYKLEVDVPVQQFDDVFIPFEAIDQTKPKLQDGDFVNIIRGTVSKNAPESDLSDTFGGNAWAGHVGMIVHDDDGTVNLIHSTVPRVREEPLDEYIARSIKTKDEDDAKGKPRLLGFKFLRLREEPMKNLQQIDGPAAPKVTLPDGGEAKF